MTLPLLDISSIILAEAGIQTDKDLCSICLDHLDDEKTIYKVEKCNHVFHAKCILEMYIKSNSKNCPLCRSQISVASNICDNAIKFKINLIKKYVKRKNANLNIVKVYTDYVNYGKQISELKKGSTIIQKEIVSTKKNNKTIFTQKLKLEQNVLELKNFMKRNTLGFTSKYRRYRRALCNKMSLKFIKDIIKDASIEIVNKINDKIENVENDLYNIKDHDIFKHYNLLRQKKKKIDYQIIKLHQQEFILKNAMLRMSLSQ